MKQQKRDEAVVKANKLATEIEKLADALKTKAEELRRDASWPAVGSLGKMRETLLDEYYPFSIGKDEDDNDAKARVLRELGI